MADTLLSASWYRVAGLKPRLAPRLKLMRQEVRDQVWHVLTEAGSGRQLRLNPQAYAFVGRCDGGRTVGDIWDLLLTQGGDDAPTQNDILRLMAQLHQSDMLEFDVAPNLAMLFERRSEQGRRRSRRWINPLLIRMRLFDPTRLLDVLEPALRPWLNGWTMVVWAACVLLGALACAVNWPQLQAAASAHLGTPSSLVLMWICYPLIKAVHELGHALAVRRFGGPVHEVGFTLFFFTPAPFVDASAANAFERRGWRVAVSAAGIMVELFLAALAVAVWLAVEPGLVRDTALVVLVICTVSSLLFNGNPLMRLDGYYILCDLLSLPNLALRSNALWSLWLRQRLLGREAGQPVELARGERKWLVLYAPLSWLYRVLLMVTLVGWLGGKSYLMGAVAAVVVVVWLAGPMVREGAGLMRLAGAGQTRTRLVSAMAGAGLIALLLLFVVPMPASTVVRGVVWPPDRAQLRSETGGFILKLKAADGATVQPGESLVTLTEPVLDAERDKRASQLIGLQAQQYQALLNDPLKAANIGEDITRTEADLARSDEQLAALNMRSAVAGQLVLPHPQDLAGSFTARGAMIGYVLSPGSTNVRVALNEADAALVRNRARSVQVRLAEQPGQSLQGVLGREVPASTNNLPSAALGERFGGEFATDPTDKQSLKTREPVFLLDVSVATPLSERVGGRAWLKFDLGYEPIGLQWLRRLRQLFLKQFSPVGQV